MDRFAGSVVVVALAAMVQSASATDPYPLDALTEMTARWADAAAEVQTMRAEVRRYVYDDVYRTVEASEGTLVFERPNRCRIELRPISTVPENPVRIDGLEYTHVRATTRTFIWNNDGLWLIGEGTESSWRTAAADDAVVLDEQPQPTEDVERQLYEDNPLWKLLVTLLGPRREPPRVRTAPSIPRPDATNVKEAILLPFDWGPSFWKPRLSLHDVVPILLSSPDAITKQGLTLKEKQVPPKGLSAVPNEALRSTFSADRINILIDEASGLPYATQAVRQGKTVVDILQNVQLNVSVRDDEFRPTDEQLKWAQ